MTEAYLENLLLEGSKTEFWDKTLCKHLKIKKFTFDNNISRLNLELSVIKKLSNIHNSIRNGILFTILDIASYLNLRGHYNGKMVTCDLSITYLTIAKIGDILNIEASCPISDHNLKFFTVKIASKDNTIALGKVSFFMVKWQERL